MNLQIWAQTVCRTLAVDNETRYRRDFGFVSGIQQLATTTRGQKNRQFMSLFWPNLLFVFAALICMPAWAAPGNMIKDEVMRQSANATAPSVGRVAKGAGVEVLARQGGWTQISHGGATGWVRILSVKTSAGSAGSNIGGVVQMGATRSDSRRVVAVAGLRGLSEDALRVARFNASELARLNQFASSRTDAESFARRVGLRAVDVAYIDAAKLDAAKRTPERSPNSFNLWGEND